MAPINFPLFAMHLETHIPSASWRWGVLTASYSIPGCLGHLQFSLWLVRHRAGAQGTYAYADAVPLLVAVGAAALIAWLIFTFRRHPHQKTILAYWLAWAACVALMDRYLTFSINEYAHYPQYGLLAWLLAKTLDPQRQRFDSGRVIFWVTLMGMGDEVLQYLWTTTRYSEYLDFNDFLVNLIAAAAGVMVYYAKAPSAPALSRPSLSKAELYTALALLLGVLAAYACDRLVYAPVGLVPPGGLAPNSDGLWQLYLQRAPGLYGSWPEGKRHGTYFVLPPVPALVTMAALGCVFGHYGKTRRRG
ncbi:MAG: hypothetical protein RLZZ401_1498, partial [Pseudomonadota bacterium]